MYKGFLVIILSLLLGASIKAQVVYEHITNENIYAFLEELANEQWIDINSTIKPYSRHFIADKLLEAKVFYGEMSKRQAKELDFYIKGFTLEINEQLQLNPKVNLLKKTKGFGLDINPLGGFYKDKLFSFQAQPIYGYSMYKNDNGTESYSYGGLQGYAYIGDHIGVYASLRDNHYSQAFNRVDYLTPIPGGNFKNSEKGGVDWSEMRGGVTFSWKWGEIGLIKDHYTWGSNNHGANIFSGKQPSFAQISLKLKPAFWLEFNYVHGWLVSEVVDSVRSYWDGTGEDRRYRAIFRPKWISANMFTIKPIKGLNFSIGNSIVYSDTDHAAYWIPIFVYKSVDHTLNATDSYGQAGQNSQLFTDVSIRLIKHLHIYGSLFSDEIKFSRIGVDSVHNFWSWKGGMQYNMGHYLRDNADEIYVSLAYKPIRGLLLKAEAFIARHGPDVKYETGADIVSEPFMEYVAWENTTYAFNARYEIVNNVYVYAAATWSNIIGDETLVKKWTPEYYQGDQMTLSGGFNIGF
ncbi:MAG: hypothetical protein B7C24_12050 [Bacteroidetes bacterium 4572_77]|nr:MAG: hypothetical protein B7C24_12050 [Bacteroidetes bacterium 4572_77]